MPAQARFGDRIPVPVTTFSPIATGGIPQQPVTSFNYENIGVNIDITPRTHHDDDVTLALKVSVQSISGAGFGGLPTFGNREINTVIRLKDGETNMLAGLIRDDERRVMNGIPGLSDLPVLGRLFAHTRTETTQTDIILTLTPHIIRVLDVNEGDLRAFRVGRGTRRAVTSCRCRRRSRPPKSAAAPPAVPTAAGSAAGGGAADAAAPGRPSVPRGAPRTRDATASDAGVPAYTLTRHAKVVIGHCSSNLANDSIDDQMTRSQMTSCSCDHEAATPVC